MSQAASEKFRDQGSARRAREKRAMESGPLGASGEWDSGGLKRGVSIPSESLPAQHHSYSLARH